MALPAVQRGDELEYCSGDSLLLVVVDRHARHVDVNVSVAGMAEHPYRRVGRERGHPARDGRWSQAEAIGQAGLDLRGDARCQANRETLDQPTEDRPRDPDGHR